ncbi:MAG: hypothetical protein IT464_07275 [Planctomycetes bacterium]|nr:hypothetical protein [Planctomycetota bacterium]
MRNLLGFTAAFAFVFLVGGLIRAAALSRTSNNMPDQPQQESQHGAHEAANQEAGAEESTPEEAKKDDAKKEEPKADLPQELENVSDPVSGKAVGENPTVLEHKGWKIRFENGANRDKFLKKPIRYYAKLSLEPTKEGKLLKVDASKYEKAAPATCGIMGGDIDADGDVFILHRGFKVFFCCWSGCGDEFIADPAKYYDHYGLVEKDGKLVLK